MDDLSFFLCRTTFSSTANVMVSTKSSSTSNATVSNSVSSSISNEMKSNPSASRSNATKFNSASASGSVSNTPSSIVTTVTYSDSSMDEDDDYDYTVDEDRVSDGIDSDSGTDIANESSDPDDPCDDASSTDSSVSSPSEESYSLASRNGRSNNNINTSLLISLTEEEKFVNQSSTDPTILLLKINMLLKRVRKLVAMIRNSSNLNRYFLKEMNLKLANEDRRTDNQDKKQTKLKELTLDMRIRWSSTFVMISRFLSYISIITSLTHDPSKKILLKSRQYGKLKNLSFTSLDWALLEALETVLTPFHRSTKFLSTRCRPTLSISQSIVHALTNFLTVPEGAPITMENLLKRQLLLNLNFYFEKHISDEQAKATLIASFLDPSTYNFLTYDDKKEAEVIISSEAPTHYAKSNSKTSLPASQSTGTTPSNRNEQGIQLNALQDFFQACGIPKQTTSPIFKPSTIKEEIAHYIATLNSRQSFSEYWSNNKDRLPILSSIVRQYNVMCATSISCESAFSISGHIHRKSRSSLAPSTLRYSMLLREYYRNK